MRIYHNIWEDLAQQGVNSLQEVVHILRKPIIIYFGWGGIQCTRYYELLMRVAPTFTNKQSEK